MPLGTPRGMARDFNVLFGFLWFPNGFTQQSWHGAALTARLWRGLLAAAASQEIQLLHRSNLRNLFKIPFETANCCKWQKGLASLLRHILIHLPQFQVISSHFKSKSNTHCPLLTHLSLSEWVRLSCQEASDSCCCPLRSRSLPRTLWDAPRRGCWDSFGDACSSRNGFNS